MGEVNLRSARPRKKCMRNLVAAAAAVATFLSAVPPDSRFIRFLRVKEVMAEPTMVEQRIKDMKKKAVDTVESMNQFLRTGEIAHLNRFKQGWNNNKKDGVFISEFVRLFNKRGTALYRIGKAFEWYKKNAVKEYKGFSPIEFAAAVRKVFSGFRGIGTPRTYDFAGLIAAQELGVPKKTNQMFAGFAYHCKKSLFGQSMLTKARIERLKARPARAVTSRLGKEVTAQLNTIAPDIAAVDRTIRSLEAQARDKPGIAVLVKEYRKKLSEITGDLDRAVNAKSKKAAEQLLSGIGTKLAVLVSRVARAAKVAVTAEALAVNFDYAVKTGVRKFPFTMGGGYGGPTSGAMSYFPFSGGIDDGINFYNALSGAEKKYFAEVLKGALKKIQVKKTVGKKEVTTTPLHGMVSNYAKRNKLSFVDAMSRLTTEAVNIHAAIAGTSGALSKIPSFAAWSLKQEVGKHRARVKSDYILEQILDLVTIGEEFRKDPKEDVWDALIRYLKTKEAQGLVTKLQTQLGTYSGIEGVLKKRRAEALPSYATTEADRLKQSKTLFSQLLKENAALSTKLSSLGILGTYFLVKGLGKLEGTVVYDKNSAKALMDAVLDVAGKDAFLVPAFVKNVVYPLADVARSSEDFTALIKAYQSFFNSMAGKTDVPIPEFRRSMLALFALTKERMPQIPSVVDHYYLEEEIRFTSTSPEMPYYYKVKPTWLERMETFPIPQFMPRVPTLSLRPPFYVPPDMQGVNFSSVVSSGALTHHSFLRGQIYHPGLSLHTLRVPPYFKIREVGLGRALRELAKIFAQYDQGKTYPWWPPVEQAGVLGGYYGKHDDYHDFEAMTGYAARLPKGAAQLAMRARQFADIPEVWQSLAATRWGRFRELSQYFHWTEANNIVEGALGTAINVCRKQMAASEKAKALKEGRPPKAKPGQDIIAYVEGYQEHPEGGEKRNRVLGRLFWIKTDGTVLETRVAKDDWVWFRNFLYKAAKTENLHLSAKAGGVPSRFDYKAPTTAQENEAEQEKPAEDRWIFRDKSGRMKGFEGAIVAFTIDDKISKTMRTRWLRDVAHAGMVGTVPKYSGGEAFINWADAVSKSINKRHAVIGIYRGTDAAELKVQKRTTDYTLKTGSDTSTETTYPAYKQHVGEVIYKLMRPPGKPGKTALEIRGVGGGPTHPQAGVRVLVEWGPKQHRKGFGVSGGYVSRSMMEDYRQMESTAKDLYTSMKTGLVQAYGWSENKAKEKGMLLAAQYMYSQLFGPQVVGGWQSTAAWPGGMKRESGVITEEGAITKYPHYGAALFMIWAKKNKVLIGGSRTPGYAFDQMNGLINDSFETMGTLQNREWQDAYINAQNDRLMDLMKHAWWMGAIGITHQGKVRVFDTVGSARLKEDLSQSYGDLESVLFFDKKQEKGYAQLLASLFQYKTLYTDENTAYLRLLGGLMSPWQKMTTASGKSTFWMRQAKPEHAKGLTPAELKEYLEGRKSVEFKAGKAKLAIAMRKPEHYEGLTGQECLSYLSSQRKYAMQMLLGRVPSKKEGKMPIRLAEAAKKRIRTRNFYYRVVPAVAEGEKPYLEIGTRKDRKRWKEQGIDVKKYVFALNLGPKVQGAGYNWVLGFMPSQEDRNNTQVFYSKRLRSALKRRSGSYYALIGDPEKSGEGYHILLGTEQDKREWEAKGHDLRIDIKKVEFAPDPKEKDKLKFIVKGGMQTEYLPAIKVIAGPILEFTMEEDGGTSVAGYEIQALVDFIKSKRFNLIAGGHYAWLKGKRLSAERIEVILSAEFKKKRSLLSTEQMALYILGYQDKVRIVVGTPDEKTKIEDEWKQIGGAIGFEMQKVKLGEESSLDFVLEAGEVTLPKTWLSYQNQVKEIEGETERTFLRGGVSYTWSSGKYELKGKRFRIGVIGGWGPASLWLRPPVSTNTVADLSNLGTYAQLFGPDLNAAYFLAYFTMFYGGTQAAVTPATYSPGTGTFTYGR